MVAELARRAGWTLTHKMIPEGQTVDVQLVNDEEHISSVKVRGPVATTTNGVKNETPPKPKPDVVA